MLALGFVEQQSRRYRLQDRLRGPAAAGLVEPNVVVGGVSEWFGRPPAARVRGHAVELAPLDPPAMLSSPAIVTKCHPHQGESGHG